MDYSSLSDAEFGKLLYAAVDAGIVPAEMFDELPKRRFGAEVVLCEYCATLDDVALADELKRKISFIIGHDPGDNELGQRNKQTTIDNFEILAAEFVYRARAK